MCGRRRRDAAGAFTCAQSLGQSNHGDGGVPSRPTRSVCRPVNDRSFRRRWSVLRRFTDTEYSIRPPATSTRRLAGAGGSGRPTSERGAAVNSPSFVVADRRPACKWKHYQTRRQIPNINLAVRSQPGGIAAAAALNKLSAPVRVHVGK